MSTCFLNAGGRWNEGRGLLDVFADKTIAGCVCVRVSTRSEREPLCVFKLVKDVCVCPCETSALADVDWQEGAAGMRPAAALCGTGTHFLSSHERVFVTGKSLHDQREQSLCRICTGLENLFFLLVRPSSGWVE